MYNSDNGKFVSKAKKAYNKTKSLTIESENANEILRQLLGNSFPQTEGKTDKSAQYYSQKRFYDRGASTEEFIDEKFNVDIRYVLNIDCNVTQNGWRPFLLRRHLIESKIPLRKDKKLDFYIVDTDCPRPYEVYWKVRNVGAEAIKRNMIRGQICRESGSSHIECTQFEVEHYVECFLVKNNVCVARDKIEVPIGTF